MQLTIDSTESLSRVLQVVGSLYGVELAVVPAAESAAAVESGALESAAPESSPAPAVAGGRGRRGARGRRKPAAKPAAKPKGARATDKPGRRRSRGAAADMTAVREWARGNGFQVSDRGRVSNTVLDAYRQANSAVPASA